MDPLPLRRLALAAAAAIALHACGARTPLSDSPRDASPPDAPLPLDRPLPRDVPPLVDRPSVPDRPSPVDASVRITAVCPPSQRAVETRSVPLAGGGIHSQGLPLGYAWGLDAGPGLATAISNSTSPTATLALTAPGTWRLRLTVTDPLGRSDSCVTVVEADAAIDLVCPADQSRYQSDEAGLAGRATSRLGRPLSYAWSVARRPAGGPTTLTPVTGSPGARLFCDALGDYVVRLTVTDDGMLTRTCQTNVHVDPDVLVTCPPDVASAPFSAVRLEGRATSRLGLPLTYRWTTESAPATSTAALTSPGTAAAGFTFDVAGDWVWRLTASNPRGNAASCTTRAFARSNEAVRVELVWNVDRSCRSCNPQGGGIDLDLHLTDLSRSMGHWAGLAPGASDCYYANCRCDRSMGMLCPDGRLMWPPLGVLNNPQLDVDHTQDLPGPENINVIEAQAGARFSVGVHYFSGSEPTPVVVRVYCGGVVVFESERVTLAPGTPGNPLWRVGDITVGGDGRSCAFTRCGAAGALTDCIRPEDRW